ncbi:galectin-9-like isoform X2 [Thrips palmi]|uniref:Galectin n=1 Tax=Thrips palmi TaxID=161013 RepID=A0A6P9AI17_THRPL|nr:galectin-9-like isoform X2 [Thrips palmi]
MPLFRRRPNHYDLPYIENLPHQLDAGRAIVVDLTVLPDALGFAINLSCGAGETPDIAFHLNPRLDRCYVARNSRTRGYWGEEEGAALGGSPFKRGQSFIIHILVTATGFKVSVDRMHFCNFPFRMPLSKVCRLEIHGDIVVSAIHHTRLQVYPDRALDALPEHSFSTIPTDHAVPWSLDIPEKENLYFGRFKPNLSSGLEITIKGRMKLLPQSFYINLQQGSQLWPHPNVHFHLNPRFAAEDSEHVVVVNGWMHGSWGTEQRYNKCRFRPGEPFTIVIYVEEQRYRVMVNGLQQAAMPHRAPPSLVDTLVVRGDLFINHVSIAKSGPAPERLLTPASPTGSCESFTHIPDEISIETMPSQENFSTFTKMLSSSEVSPKVDCQQPVSVKSPTVSVEEKPSTSVPSAPVSSEILTSVSTFESKTINSSESDSSPEDSTLATPTTTAEKTVNFEPAIGSGSGESLKSDGSKSGDSRK